MKINKIIPKDKSNFVYYEERDLDLKCTKPLLIILKKGYPKFTVGVYVHSKKSWLDEGSFNIDSDNIVGWIDLDILLSDFA
jgi:hypothetical protein